MKILTYNEGLERASNKDWFVKFYKVEDICSDDEVRQINELASKINPNPLPEYFEMDEDIMLQKEYFEDLLEELNELVKN